jgi:hypothetical protein
MAWTGILLSGVYVAFAVLAVIADRAPSKGGNWITLSGMGSLIITLPVSAPMEILGAKLDYRSNVQMAFAIAVCAGLVYLMGWVLESVFRAVFGSG